MSCRLNAITLVASANETIGEITFYRRDSNLGPLSYSASALLAVLYRPLTYFSVSSPITVPIVLYYWNYGIIQEDESLILGNI